MCRNNWICAKLELADVVVEETEDDIIEPPSLTAEKHNLKYIVVQW